MRKYFNQKVIWITGASSGIGEALAYALSAQGARLILSSRRESELERVKNACPNKGLVKILPMDLTDIPSLEAKAAHAIVLFDHIDMIIHNGGISSRSLAADTNLDVHRRVMEVDYFSYIELTRLLVPHFHERNTGHIVVMSSVMGKIGTPDRSAYAAAKHALHGYFDCLRAEVSPQGIHVTIFTPGYIRTNVALNAMKGDGTPLNQNTGNIEHGMAPEKAAQQMLRALAAKKYETYIGKFSMERLALLVWRFFPSLLIRLAPGFAPK